MYWRILTLLALFALGSTEVSWAQPAGQPAKAAEAKKAGKKTPPKSTTRRRQQWPVKRPKGQVGSLPPMGPVPFVEGERLAFQVKMFNAVAGEVILAVGKRSTLDGVSVVPFVGFLRSSDFLSKFYPIEDRLVVVVDERTFLPMKSDFYIKENGKVVDYHTMFNQKQKQVRSRRVQGGKTLDRDFSAASEIYEALSSVYAARRMDIKPGTKFRYYIWDGRRERLVEVEGGPQEKVWTPQGFVMAQRVNLSTTITGGFVKKDELDTPARKGSAWFALDAQRTPVRLISPTKLGDAEAVLVKRYVDAKDAASP